MMCYSVGNIVMCFMEYQSVDVRRIGGSPSISGPSTDYTGSYTLSWSSSSNTKTYQLQERYNNGSWSTIHNSSSRSKSRSSRKVGTYQYRLRSCADGKSVSYGSTKTVKVESLSRPAITLAPTSKSKTFTVSWDKVTGTEFYVLERSPKNDGTNGWEEICRKKEKDCKSTSKQNTVPSDGTYSYRVQACNSLGCSAHSAVKKITGAQRPTVPEIIVPDGNTNGEFNV